jgi:hypothetical protein
MVWIEPVARPYGKQEAGKWVTIEKNDFFCLQTQRTHLTASSSSSSSSSSSGSGIKGFNPKQYMSLGAGTTVSQLGQDKNTLFRSFNKDEGKVVSQIAKSQSKLKRKSSGSISGRLETVRVDVRETWTEASVKHSDTEEEHPEDNRNRSATKGKDRDKDVGSESETKEKEKDNKDGVRKTFAALKAATMGNREKRKVGTAPTSGTAVGTVRGTMIGQSRGPSRESSFDAERAAPSSETEGRVVATGSMIEVAYSRKELTSSSGRTSSSGGSVVYASGGGWSKATAGSRTERSATSASLSRSVTSPAGGGGGPPSPTPLRSLSYDEETIKTERRLEQVDNMPHRIVLRTDIFPNIFYPHASRLPIAMRSPLSTAPSAAYRSQPLPPAAMTASMSASSAYSSSSSSPSPPPFERQSSVYPIAENVEMDLVVVVALSNDEARLREQWQWLQQHLLPSLLQFDLNQGGVEEEMELYQFITIKILGTIYHQLGR